MRFDPRAFDAPQAILLGLVLGLALAIIVAASTSAASFGAYNTRWDGGADLRSQASAVSAEPEVLRNVTGYERRPPNATVAVILSPDVGYSPNERARIEEFVRTGGTLVIAEDFGTHGNTLLAGIGAQARVDGRLLRDERNNHRSPAMPVAQNFSNSAFTQGVNHLTLNYGTAVQPGNATILATTSEYAYLDTNENGELDDPETLRAYPVATVEQIGQGQVIVLGDPSALINVMLDRPGNRAFVRNIFQKHEYVLLDYSHVTSLPPLAVALLVLRRSIIAQLVTGLGGITLIGLWIRHGPIRVQHHFSDQPLEDSSIRLTATQAEAFLTQRHPDWDEKRIRRVIQGIFTRRRDSDTNE